MITRRSGSSTKSSSAQVPRAVVGEVSSISGWWTRWLERKLGLPIASTRNFMMASRLLNAYLPPPYEVVASSVKQSARSVHSF
jgi:hypothetical protein